MLDQPAFGRRLRQLRQKQGLTQASLTGPRMSAAYVSRLEAGSRPPTMQSVQHLAAKLNVPATAFDETEVTSLADVLATTVAIWDSAAASDLRRLLMDALELDTHADLTVRWQACAQLAKLQSQCGDRDDEYRTLRELRRVSEELVHPVLLVHTHLRLARCERALGRIEDARGTARGGLLLAAQAGLDNDDVTRLKILLVSAAAELGDLAEAKRLSEETCEALNEPNRPLAGEVWWTAATVATRTGDYARADLLLGKALAAVRSRDDLALWTRLRLAAAALTLQGVPARLDLVERYLNEVKPALDLVGTPANQQEHAFLTAQLRHHQGDHAAAAALCEAIDRDTLLLGYRDRVRYRMLRAQIRIAQGDLTALDDLTALAGEVQEARMLDLAAEIWRTAAQTRHP
ncbi:helix-turn-helix transcriptional regulator [Streptomyces sp. NPDC029216]|uniref:helix-turn-helix domain-containing protein n=1 Tax=Streptomyces sp. NPDC029216 TaxID=3154701 RepID=UPI00340D6A13